MSKKKQPVRRQIDESTCNVKWDLDTKTLPDVVKQIEEWIKEYGPEARLDISTEHDYVGGEYASVRVCWKRDETDEEYVERLAQEGFRKKQQEDRDRAEFERLAAKFGEKK